MNSKYENGYIPKIEYYQYKVTKSIQNKDWASAQYYTEKLSYFLGRQYTKENQVIAGVDFSQSLNQLNNLTSQPKEWVLSSKGLKRVR
jgi:hypothetical protein